MGFELLVGSILFECNLLCCNLIEKNIQDYFITFLSLRCTNFAVTNSISENGCNNEL